MGPPPPYTPIPPNPPIPDRPLAPKSASVRKKKKQKGEKRKRGGDNPQPNNHHYKPGREKVVCTSHTTRVIVEREMLKAFPESAMRKTCSNYR